MICVAWVVLCDFVWSKHEHLVIVKFCQGFCAELARQMLATFL